MLFAAPAYNLYPVVNEVSYRGVRDQFEVGASSNLIIDENYGRLFTPDVYEKICVYGISDKLRPFIELPGFSPSEFLRVPYRKIPIFSVTDIYQARQIIERVKHQFYGWKVLLRGQTRQHFIYRTEEEKLDVFGDRGAQEPSFLPSFLRGGWGRSFIESLWFYCGEIILNDLEHDWADWKDADWDVDACSVRETMQTFRRSRMFDFFSLGIAQHYGLPSVGLDLTDHEEIALWFASYRIDVDSDGAARCQLATDELDRPTIYVFRCSDSAVFDHKNVRPAYFPKGRADVQRAYFGNVGWGLSRNQMASYLVCALDVKALLGQGSYAAEHLFPTARTDKALEIFLSLKSRMKNEAEVAAVFKRLYALA